MTHHTFILYRDPADDDLHALERRVAQLPSLGNRRLSWRSGFGGCPRLHHFTTAAGEQSPMASGTPSDHTVRIGGVAGDRDGSVVANSRNLRFSCDRFGSQSMWYHVGPGTLIVSTSQTTITALKGSFNPSDEALAWFISSGCQGPFVSWDRDIQQVRPDTDYSFDLDAWNLSRMPRPNMAVPGSGTGSVGEYLDLYETTVVQNIERVLGEYGDRGVLLPLSGGLDSRLILALAHRAGLDKRLRLVNWGIPSSDGVFDDMSAASRVAAYYGKELIRGELPEYVDNPDEVLDRFLVSSEGRIDHFNGYTDGLAMWDRFSKAGFRCVLRGDIPFTEGLDTNEAMARAHLGLERLDDFANVSGTPLYELASVQAPFDIAREDGESLIRWRDRLYTQWRIPMVISAFSDIVSGHVDNQSPMMSWGLYCGYMALPDSAKGNKKHIEALWRKHDRSGVPSHATGSLRAPAAAFATPAGTQYVSKELARIADEGASYSPLASWLRNKVPSSTSSGASASTRRWSAARGRLADALPLPVKGWLKARRVRTLPYEVIAYRLILADKIQAMYGQCACAPDTAGVSP